MYLINLKWPKNLICFIRLVGDTSPGQNHKKTFVVFDWSQRRDIS